MYPKAFWSHIANAIEKEEKLHPSDKRWTKRLIEIFLSKFRNRLLLILEKDMSKAKLCTTDRDRTGNMKEKLNLKEWRGPDYSTILRIFKKKSSSGQIHFRHQFAIYFGCDSYEDYVLKHSIIEEFEEKKNVGRQKKIKRKEIKNIFNAKIINYVGKNKIIENNMISSSSSEEE